MKNKQLNDKNFYSEKELKKLVKRGTLVKKLDKGTSCHLDASNHIHDYKKSFGAVPVWNMFKTKIKTVYAVFEGFDGEIYYYEYPQ